MALEHILKHYKSPDVPTVYTGLFKERFDDREWTRTNKHICGVSYSKYGDAKNIVLSDELTLFDVFHGCCGDFATYFIKKHADWKPVKMYRTRTSLPSIVHIYCVNESGGKRLFADARGITDDVKEFFSDYSFGKDFKLTEFIPYDDPEYYNLEACMKKAYQLIFSGESC